MITNIFILNIKMSRVMCKTISIFDAMQPNLKRGAHIVNVFCLYPRHHDNC